MALSCVCCWPQRSNHGPFVWRWDFRPSRGHRLNLNEGDKEENLTQGKELLWYENSKLKIVFGSCCVPALGVRLLSPGAGKRGGRRHERVGGPWAPSHPTFCWWGFALERSERLSLTTQHPSYSPKSCPCCHNTHLWLGFRLCHGQSQSWWSRGWGSPGTSSLQKGQKIFCGLWIPGFLNLRPWAQGNHSFVTVRTKKELFGELGWWHWHPPSPPSWAPLPGARRRDSLQRLLVALTSIARANKSLASQGFPCLGQQGRKGTPPLARISSLTESLFSFGYKSPSSSQIAGMFSFLW